MASLSVIFKGTRILRKKTRQQVAAAVRVSPNLVYRLETGDDRIAVETVGDIARELGIGFDWKSGEATPPADLRMDAIERVAAEPRTSRKVKGVDDPFAALEALAGRLKLTPQAVAAHFARIANNAAQQQADLEQIMAAEAAREQKEQGPPPRKARAG